MPGGICAAADCTRFDFAQEKKNIIRPADPAAAAALRVC